MNNNLTLLDRTFEPMISSEEILERVSQLAEVISRDYAGKKPIFLSVLNGAFMFTSDLLKSINLDCEVHFVRYKSYEGVESTGKVKELMGVPEEVNGRDVIVVEDIVESGKTIEYLSKKLEINQPASVKICALLFKPSCYHKSIPITYSAFEIGEEFVVGYGLDYDGAGRNLKEIYRETT